MEHRFQINLRGLIDLLSNHLYSTPEVFVRELLQNGVDAIRARSYLEPRHVGEIIIEVHERAGKPPTLSFSDNGVGLSRNARARFSSGVGLSNTRARLECLYGAEQRLDFTEEESGLSVQLLIPSLRPLRPSADSSPQVALA